MGGLTTGGGVLSVFTLINVALNLCYYFDIRILVHNLLSASSGLLMQNKRSVRL